MKKSLLLFLMGAACFSSCKKGDLSGPVAGTGIKGNQKINAIAGASITDGRVYFATRESFQQLMSEAVADTLNSNHVALFVSSIAPSHFTSYSEKAMTTNSTSVPATSGQNHDIGGVVEDPQFAQVLNANGELQVENTIYKITPNGTFAVQPGSISTLNSILDANGMLKAPYSTNLVEIDSDNGLYKVTDGIFLMDTYAYVRSGNQFPANTSTGPVIQSAKLSTQSLPSPNTAPYTNMDIYPFGTKYTVVGKIIEGIFGDAHYKYFANSPDRRLKVDFWNRNWLVYSSLTVRAVIQKKNSFLGISIWGPVDNKDEMRLGWTPVVMKLDIPSITKPNTTAPPDASTLAGKLLKNQIHINLGDWDYLTLYVSDVMDANNAFPFLSSSAANKLNNFSFDVNGFVKKRVDTEIDQLFATIKQKVGYVPGTNRLAFLKNNTIMINGEEQVHDANTGNGVMSKTFSWNSAIVGYSSTGSNGSFTFKPAKNVELVSGGAYAVGKLNGEWVGIAVVKDYPGGWTVTPAAKYPLEGQFIRNDNTGQVYIMMDGKLRYIPDQNVLHGLFVFQDSMMFHFTSAELARVPVGNAISPDNGLINDTTNGKVYFRERSVLRYILGTSHKELYHFNWKIIQNVNGISANYTFGADI